MEQLKANRAKKIGVMKFEHEVPESNIEQQLFEKKIIARKQAQKKHLEFTRASLKIEEVVDLTQPQELEEASRSGLRVLGCRPVDG